MNKGEKFKPGDKVVRVIKKLNPGNIDIGTRGEVVRWSEAMRWYIIDWENNIKQGANEEYLELEEIYYSPLKAALNET